MKTKGDDMKNMKNKNKKKTEQKKHEEQKEARIEKELNALSKLYGNDFVRLTAQRWCKRLREKSNIEKEIAKKEAELKRLKANK